jgi:hypothetical protein
MFAAEQLLILILAAAVGGALGLAVTTYTLRRNTRAERIAHQIKVALQQTLFPVLHPRFFRADVPVVFPDQSPPRNKDIPHVEYARFERKFVYPNREVDVLIKVADGGFDLPNPAGIAIRDHRDNQLGVVPLGLGFVITTFHTSIDDQPGVRRLTIRLQDRGEHSTVGPNECIQTLPFTIDHSEKERWDEERHRTAVSERQGANRDDRSRAS